MSIRAKLVLLVSGLAVAMVGLSLLLVGHRLTVYFAAAAREELTAATQTLKQSLAESLEGYRIEGKVVADATLAKEALIQRSPDLAFTYADSARDTTGVRYVLILDRAGAVLADVRSELPLGAPFPMGTAGAARGASVTDARVGFMKLGDSLVAVAIAPSAMNGEVVGYVVLGDRVTEQRLPGAQRLGRSDITLLGLDGTPLTSSLPPDEAVEVARGWASIARAGDARGPREIALGDAPALLAGEPLVGLSGEALGVVAVSRSLRAERTTVRDLERWLLGVGVGLTMLAIALGVILAYRTSGPIRELIESAQRIARGERIPGPAGAPPSVGRAQRHAQQPAKASVPAPRSKDEIELLSSTFNLMASAVADRQERLEKEMELARRIQHAILPRRFDVPGLELAAEMRPASEVGGDYYDVLPTRDGCWIGIGDVVGHGLDAGLTMLMVQSMIAALVARDESASPREILAVLNDALHANIHDRLDREDHVTLTLLRYRVGGSVVFAGAHEDIVVCRAATGEVSSIATSGPWVGFRPGMAPYIQDHTVELGAGDLLVLYTDGVTEARNGNGEMFGLERLQAELVRSRREPVGRIRDLIADAAAGFAPTQLDDITLLVARQAAA